METNIGSIIFDYCRRNNISIATLAGHLHITPEGVYRQLKKNDIKVSRLITISSALNHNFFEDIYSSVANPGDQPTPQYHTIQQLKHEIALLRRELDWYHKYYGLPKIVTQ
jgi:hypothetical protein